MTRRAADNAAPRSRFPAPCIRLGSATITTSRQYLHARNKDAMVNLPIIDGILGARRVVGEEHDSGWIDGLIGKNINGGELKNIRLKVTL